MLRVVLRVLFFVDGYEVALYSVSLICIGSVVFTLS